MGLKAFYDFSANMEELSRIANKDCGNPVKKLHKFYELLKAILIARGDMMLVDDMRTLEKRAK